LTGAAAGTLPKKPASYGLDGPALPLAKVAERLGIPLPECVVLHQRSLFTLRDSQTRERLAA
jgi:hypothetical protein